MAEKIKKRIEEIKKKREEITIKLADEISCDLFNPVTYTNDDGHLKPNFLNLIEENEELTNEQKKGLKKLSYHEGYHINHMTFSSSVICKLEDTLNLNHNEWNLFLFCYDLCKKYQEKFLIPLNNEELFRLTNCQKCGKENIIEANYCNKCELYGECDHQGAYKTKEGKWCFEIGKLRTL